MYTHDCQYPWATLRAQVAETTPLAAFNWSDWPSSGGFNFRSNFPDARWAKIMFYGSDAADEDFTWILYGRHKTNGPIETLLAGTAILGTRVATPDVITGATLTNGKWADQITLTTGTMDEHDVIQNTGDNNEIAAIIFPMQGIVELFLEVDLDGGGVTATSAGAIITGIYNE